MADPSAFKGLTGFLNTKITQQIAEKRQEAMERGTDSTPSCSLEFGVLLGTLCLVAQKFETTDKSGTIRERQMDLGFF
ncbi:unnamed protein product, partial [Vitis vinifera]